MGVEVGAGSGVGGGGNFVWGSLVDAWVWISTEGAQEMQKLAIGYRLSVVVCEPSGSWSCKHPSDQKNRSTLRRNLTSVAKADLS